MVKMEVKVSIVIVVMLAWLGVGNPLLGFDCHSKAVQMQTISLAGVEECQVETTPETKENLYVQVLQRRLTKKIYYQSCGLFYHEYVFHCGMHSHVSLVADGITAGYKALTREECRKAHLTGMYQWAYTQTITDLKGNSTQRGAFHLVGSTTADADCTGGVYTARGRRYESVTVTIKYEVILHDGWAEIDLESGLISLPGGHTVDLKQSYFIDLVYGHTFWEVHGGSKCEPDSYEVLYEGKATLFKEPRPIGVRQLLVVDSADYLFALEIQSPVVICHIKCLTTEHPRLIVQVLDGPGTGYFRRQSNLPPLEVSMATYVNSKFVFVERHIKTQIMSLYYEFSRQACELRRSTLLHLLSLAFINEEEFAFSYMGERGYTAVRRGEVIYLIKCVPTYVSLRKTTQCYSDLPVLYENKTAFLSPKSGIVKTTGVQVECSSVTPAWFYLQDGWYSITGGVTGGQFTPKVLSPNKKTNWTYVSPEHLAARGIYTEEDLRNFEQKLLFHGEKESIMNILTQGSVGRSLDKQGVGVDNLLSADYVEKLGDKVLSRIWGFFSVFGTWSSTIIGLVMIVKILKFLANSIINGTLLYKTFGFGMSILACCWSNLTHLFLQKAPPAAASGGAIQQDDRASTPTEQEESEDASAKMVPAASYSVYPPLGAGVSVYGVGP